VPEQVGDQGMRDRKVFILLGILVITKKRVQRRRSGKGEGEAANTSKVKGTRNHQLQKITPLGLVP